LFDWYWFFVFYLMIVHVNSVVISLYVHRGIGHGHFTFSPAFHHVCRFYLWFTSHTGPHWMETYAARHRKHHRYSDSVIDAQSPHHLTFSQMFSPWKVIPSDVEQYCPEIRTPDDWLQRHLYDSHRNLGICVLALVNLYLFGVMGLVVGTTVMYFSNKYLGIYIGNYVVHKFGFTYAGNSGSDRSRNLFPFGILFAGEELHNNHHNDTRSAKFSKRWFEFDIGYVYARIFSYLGWLKFRNTP
jgi:stearoyl-CoA desaturase (Delta-9 desaturase)